MLYMWFRYGKPDISHDRKRPAGRTGRHHRALRFRQLGLAVIIGAIAGILLCISVFFVERTLKIDDPVGAISVHGVNGAWGVLSLGLFADGTYGDGLTALPGR